MRRHADGFGRFGIGVPFIEDLVYEKLLWLERNGYRAACGLGAHASGGSRISV